MVIWNKEKTPGAIIVTGASRGIGAAIAKLIGTHGLLLPHKQTKNVAYYQERSINSNSLRGTHVR